MTMTVEFFAPPSQSLTLLLCSRGIYTPANGAGDAATETARAGLYTATSATVPALRGWHTAHIIAAAGWELPIGDVYLVDGGTCRVDDAEAAAAAAIAAAGIPAAAGTDAASKILATPANKLATDSSGAVTPTAASKTGYSLSATGLDAIADPDDLTPAAVPTTFTQKLRWLIQRFWKAEKTATTIVVKNEAGQTITTQTITPSGSDQTTGAPS